jgi:hypothetical protein
MPIGAADLSRDIVRPLIALALGLLPLMLFGGASSKTTVNGQVVQDSQFNVLGLLLAVVGLVIAWRCVVASGGNRLLRSSLAGVAAIVCVIQLALSAGFFTLEHLKEAAAREPLLPPLKYSGLNRETQQMARNIVSNNDEATVRRDIVNRYVYMFDDTNKHTTYADSCHQGRYRVDASALKVLPDFLSPVDRTAIERRVAELAPRQSPQCSDSGMRYFMVEVVGNILQSRDVLAIEVDGYRKRFRSGP